MSNPELWSGKAEVKEGPLSSIEATAKALSEKDIKKLDGIRNVYFHGSKSGISKRLGFKPDEFGIHFGTFETANKLAEGRQGVTEAFLIDLKNPLKTERDFARWEWYVVSKLFNKDGVITDEQLEYVQNKKDNDALIKVLKDNGYDGIEYTNFYEGGGKSIIPFDQKSIIPISSAYHAAKKDGSNPELVKAVEDLLGEKAEGKEADPILAALYGESVPKSFKDFLKKLGEKFFVHGTKSDFTKYDLKKAGTGEGMAAYGNGMYVGDDILFINNEYAKNFGEGTNENLYLLPKKGLKIITPEQSNSIDVLKKIANEIKSNPKFNAIKGATEIADSILNDIKNGDAKNPYWAEEYIVKLSFDGLDIYDKIMPAIGIDGVGDLRSYEENRAGQRTGVVIFSPERFNLIKTRLDELNEKFNQIVDVDPIIEALDKGKIKGVVGMNAAVWNATIDTIKAAYIAGKSLAEAINEGIAYLKSKGEEVSKYQDALDDIRKAEKPRVATFFSGAGTMEAALPKSESVMAVEYSPTYMKAYNDAFGTEYKARDVTQIDPQEVKAANPDIFHASPVCKNFSKAKNAKTVEKPDMDSAEAVARVIREAKPPVVTIENVPGYKDTVPFKEIIKALDDAGYTYDVGVYNAADYGGVQNRKRLLVRAVLDGKLPALPKKQKPGDWYKAVEDLIDDAPDAPFTTKTKEKNWEQERIDEMIADERLDPSKPIITMGASAYQGEAAAANSGNPSPTLLSSSNQVPRIIMPDGRIKRVTPEMMKRLMDLPLSYPVPADAKVAKEVLGNGMDGAFTKALIEPLIKQLTPEQELKQAFDKWKSETGKLGIVPNWERQAKADIELFNAAKKYLLAKIGQGAYAFEQFLKDLTKVKVENIDEDRSKWKKFYNDTIKEAAPTEEGKAETPPPPVTPPAAGRAEGEGETKERKTITSIKGLEDISEQVKEALFGETTRYTVLPNQVSLNEANAILNAMGEEKAKALVLDGDENIPDAFRVTLGEVLIKKFNSEGKYNDAVDVATGIANEATGWGQAIQALSLIKFLTPEGQLLAATRTINALRDKRFKAEEGKMNRVKKAFKKADEEAIEGAIDAVVAQTEETPAPKATRAKTWGEKNKIVTKAVYEAAKKALKKFAFTGVPPELITIAAYHVEAGARSFADFSKEMVKDFGRKVRPYLKAAYKAAQKKVGGTGYSTDAEITTHLTQDLDKDIREAMKESGVQIRDLIRQHYSEGERTKEALTKELVDKLGLDASDAAIIAAKVDAEYNRLATEKKANALKAIERRLLRKPPVRKKAEEKLIELSNLGALDEKTFKEEYARAMGFPEITKENAAKIKELAEKVQNAKEGRPKFNAIINLLNYQASLPGVDKMDLATSVWMASLLSGPATQLKNIFANSYNMGALALNVAAQSPKDIPFLLRGLAIGLGNGLQEGGSTMITGQSPIKQAAAAQGILERTKFSPYNPFGYYKYVPRFMLAADAVTYGGLKEMRAYQLALSEARDKYPTQNAYQKAIDILAQTDAQLQSAQAEAEQEYQEALADIDADTSLNKVQKEAKKAAAKLDRSRRVYDIVEQNRPNQLVKEAHDFALRGTFNNPPDGVLGMAARFFNGITHRVPAVRFFVPFVNVITNVANEYVNYSPLGYARAMKGGSITGNRKTFTEQDRKELMIKATIGTTAAIAAFVLSGIGGDDEEEPFFQITADGYNDYKKNKELELTGWRPYSIKVGNRWISYKLTPMAAILAGVGALRDRERYGKEKLTENALNYVVAPMQEFVSTVAETSFLGSAETFLSGVLGATKGDKGQKLVEWASKTGGAAVPILGTNLYQQMAERVYDALEVSDKEYRGADGAIGIFAKMLRNVPVIRDEFQNAVNGLGEELPPQTGGVIFSKKEEGPHAKLWQLLADKKATTGRPDRRGAAYIDINGNEKAMNDEQFYFFAKTRGEYIRTLMENQYHRLKDMDEKEFGKWMESTRTSANRFANGELALQSEKGIYEKGIKKYKAEAQHEKDRLMYALERGDVKDVKFAFDNYEPLSQDGKGEDKRKIFVEIVKDDIMPSGVNSGDRVDFYKGVFLKKNLKIRVQEKQPNGKVKMVSKPFNEVFTEEERAAFKRKYETKEEDVARRLSILDKALEKKYATKTSEEALWRKYLKMGMPKK